MTGRRFVFVFAALALGAAALAGPSAAAPDPRLAARLDEASAQAVQALVARARADSLPAEPLIQRALEGATKGAPGPRIVDAVEALLGRLRTARRLIGPSSGAAELVAAAGALQAGVDTATVTRIRADAPDRDLTVRLVVLADLIGRGVPGENASAVIIDWSRKGVGDDVFLDLRRGVEAAILSGSPPEAAMAARVRALGPGPPAVPAPRAPKPGEGGGP
jgi:hypothetical protein